MEKPKLNILIYVLDDYQPTLEAISISFDKAGIKDYKVFNSSIKFIESLNEDVHIAVIDYWLKGANVNGLQVCRLLLEKYPQCFVIIMSGQEDNDVIVDFLNSGADRYIIRKDQVWIEKLLAYVKEGVTVVQKNLDWYYELISRKKDLAEAHAQHAQHNR